MRPLILVAALVAACVCAPVQEMRRATFTATELPTVAEASGFTRTSTHAEVLQFFERLAQRSDLVQPISLGSSGEGRDLMAVLLADPPLHSAAEVRASDKPLVLLFGNIHAGEVCGKEALSMLARELAGGHPLLERVNLALLPDYNPDGNDQMAADNRPGQVGPVAMGRRANAQGLDLNRDWIKADAPETRAFIGFLRAFDPLVIVDTHTTNGSHHRYTITYQGPKHPAGDPRLTEYVRDTLLPAVGEVLHERTGFDSFFYGNFEARNTLWTTYPAEPRYGAAYRGLRNRVTILSEAYAYASYEDRVIGTLEFCRAIVEYTALHGDEIRDLCAAADARGVARGREPSASDLVALRVEARTFDELALVKGFEEFDPSGARIAPGAPRDWPCQVENDFVATLSARLPRAYVIDADAGAALEQLALHGIEVQRLVRPVELDLEIYRVLGTTTAARPFEGHTRTEEIDVTVEHERRTLPIGTHVVLTAQPLGALAAYLLEPQAEDGLVAWNFFDGLLADGARYPVGRCLAAIAPDALAREQ